VADAALEGVAFMANPDKELAKSPRRLTIGQMVWSIRPIGRRF